MYKFGRLLSAIVSQNIAIVISIGLIRAIFGVYGWFPNDSVNLLTGPLLNWLLPVMFGYTGGHLIGGKRGGAVAAIVVFSLALASTVPMIFMAFLLGPGLGWIVSRLERLLENRLPSGFELLMANFVSAILAGGLAVFCFVYGGQAISRAIEQLNDYIVQIAYSGWLPISAAIIEPAKVFFLNNVMSYGILGPLGISQIRSLSKSVYFLLEANPGPAMGMLLAYVIRMRGKWRATSASALAIHSLGGIQEVYFPYVLMRPQLLLPLIAGNMAGIYAFQYFNAGLVSIPSPASLLLIAGLTPPGDMAYVLLGISVSTAVSLLLSLLVIRAIPNMPEKAIGNREHDVVRRLVHVQQWEEVKRVLRPVSNLQGREERDGREKPERAIPEAPRPAVPAEAPAARSAEDEGSAYTVCFACDAGMGSSAMGAAILRKRLRAAQLEAKVTVVHSSIDQIPPAARLIVTHDYLLRRATEHAPGRDYVSLANYMDPAAYDTILEKLRDLAALR
ncbi:PTS transporter subunit EIIC [Cohnella hongkongensis]|uniref:PTS system mannitol-specific EIICB component n=1 Tax=Cohnella hongkongensis TaxID=178337 RepID=A0ABV9FDM0_9BACL